jgi:hypothetical protein
MAFDNNPVLFTDVSWRPIHQVDIQRGRQYELDTVMAGNYSAEWSNDDQAFDPLSTFSPFAGSVLPEKSVQVTAQYPNTINLLSKDQATGGEQTFILAPGNTSMQLFSPVINQIITTDTGFVINVGNVSGAHDGTQYWAATVPTTMLATQSALTFPVPVEAVTTGRPAKTYTYSAFISSTVNMTVTPAIKWLNAAGGTVSTTTGTPVALVFPAYPRMTVTGTVPAGAVTAQLQSLVTTAPASSAGFSLDSAQFEVAGSASTWVSPGNTYSLYTGGVERYPKITDLSGTRTTTRVTATDSLSILPQTNLLASFNAMVLTPNGAGQPGPNFVYTLGDSSGSTTATDSAAKRNPATFIVPTGGTASRNTFGVSPSDSSLPPNTAFTGVVPAGPASTGANTGSYTVLKFNPATVGGQVSDNTIVLSIPGRTVAGQTVKGPPSVNFTRMIAFRTSSTAPAVQSILWEASGYGDLWHFSLFIDPSFNVNIGIRDTAGNSTNYLVGSTANNTWHILFASIDATGNNLIWSLDNNPIHQALPATFAPGPYYWDLMGGNFVTAGAKDASFGLQGYLMYAAEWPFVLSDTLTNNISNAFFNAFNGDTSDARAGRILGWANYTGPSNLDPGYATSLGPASDVDGNDALTCLQNVANTENGEVFIDGAGVVRLYNRGRRYTPLVPTFTFGENVAGGELPYESVELDFDTTNINNATQITQVSTNAIAYATTVGGTTPSSQLYGARTLSQGNQSTVFQDCLDDATYLAQNFGFPRVRGATVIFHPASNPALLWPSCLQFELGQYVLLNRRPKGLTASSAVTTDAVYGYIENISWHFDNMQSPSGGATVTLQISPAPGQGAGPSIAPWKPWNLAPLWGTLSGTNSSGQPTVNVNVPSGNMGSAVTLVGMIPVAWTGPTTNYGGLQLELGVGTANSETVLVSAVTATTITFSSNLTKTHAPGEFFREVTDPILDQFPPGQPGQVVTDANYKQFDTFSTLGDGTTAFNEIAIVY